MWVADFPARTAWDTGVLVSLEADGWGRYLIGCLHRAAPVQRTLWVTRRAPLEGAGLLLRRVQGSGHMSMSLWEQT